MCRILLNLLRTESCRKRVPGNSHGEEIAVRHERAHPHSDVFRPGLELREFEMRDPGIAGNSYNVLDSGTSLSGLMKYLDKQKGVC
jgi:hypothetical protein